MRNIQRWLQRREELVNDNEGLTLEDVELILSCLPKDTADTIMNELSEFAKQEFKGVDDRQLAKLAGIGKPKSPSGLHGKTLELVLKDLPPECAAALMAKLKEKEIYEI
ncbi:hypothetical protein DS62_12835 [Smithella sp. SC_K08D17]|jgi:flagellar motor switch protein FliG|nr:hypothetical protein DS62_12835 [Smithella sp. SC_K08D17]